MRLPPTSQLTFPDGVITLAEAGVATAVTRDSGMRVAKATTNRLRRLAISCSQHLVLGSMNWRHASVPPHYQLTPWQPTPVATSLNRNETTLEWHERLLRLLHGRSTSASSATDSTTVGDKPSMGSESLPPQLITVDEIEEPAQD